MVMAPMVATSTISAPLVGGHFTQQITTSGAVLLLASNPTSAYFGFWEPGESIVNALYFSPLVLVAYSVHACPGPGFMPDGRKYY